MWNYEDKENLIENIIVRYKYKDDVLRMVNLIPKDGYLIHFIEDTGFTDEEGNITPSTYYECVNMSPKADIHKYEAVSINDIEVAEESE